MRMRILPDTIRGEDAMTRRDGNDTVARPAPGPKEKKKREYGMRWAVRGLGIWERARPQPSPASPPRLVE